MLKMRLQRIGRRNSPTYRVVVVDSRQAVSSGTFVDLIGSYEPKSGTVALSAEKAKLWISRGVRLSPTVHNMLVSQKVIDAKKIMGVAPKKEVEATPQTEAATPSEAA